MHETNEQRNNALPRPIHSLHQHQNNSRVKATVTTTKRIVKRKVCVLHALLLAALFLCVFDNMGAMLTLHSFFLPLMTTSPGSASNYNFDSLRKNLKGVGSSRVTTEVKEDTAGKIIDHKQDNESTKQSNTNTNTRASGNANPKSFATENVSSRHVVIDRMDTTIYDKGERSSKQHLRLHNGSGRDEQAQSSPSSLSDGSSFYTDLELIELIGEGTISFGFKARYKNKTRVAKIATDKDLYWSDIEIDALRVLNASPTISNIPTMHHSIRSMPNPFFAMRNETYLKKQLGISAKGVEELITKRRISLIVTDYLGGRRNPKDLGEVRRLMKSLLETIRFAHSRNVMHCDIHDENYLWDGTRVSFFDWNAAYFWHPNAQIPIHYRHAPTHLFPPEAQKNTSAVHTSVHAFDVYTIGKLMKGILKESCGITSKTIKEKKKKWSASDGNHDKTHGRTKKEDSVLAYELANWMMIADPYQRPDTTTALAHEFFSVTTS